MKKFAILAPAALLVLSACGESTDASEEAVADTVEVPADDAMATMPDPVVDGALAESDTVDSAIDAATVDAETAADSADAAQAAADDALDAAAAAQAATNTIRDAAE